MLKFMKMVKCLSGFEYFTVFLKNRNFISKIRISNVTDYAALMKYSLLFRGRRKKKAIRETEHIIWNKMKLAFKTEFLSRHDSVHISNVNSVDSNKSFDFLPNPMCCNRILCCFVYLSYFIQIK